MLRHIAFSLVLGLSPMIAMSAPQLMSDNEVGHLHTHTHFGHEGIDTFASVKHGADGALFLDPYFLTHLEDVQDKQILDAGSGAGPWAIYAAKNGARIINCSFGKRNNEGGDLVKETIAFIGRKYGVLVIAASGNSSLDTKQSLVFCEKDLMQAMTFLSSVTLRIEHVTITL